VGSRALLPIRDVFLEEAEDYLGIREQGGDNRGPAVEFFQKLGEIRPGQPWCAAYVNACAEIACSKKNLVSPLEAIRLEGYVQAYYEYAVAQNWLVDRPQAGDLFMVWHGGTINRYAHIGIVAAATDEGILSLEGNSNDDGSRNGIGVFQNLRAYSPRIVFADPWSGG